MLFSWGLRCLDDVVQNIYMYELDQADWHSMNLVEAFSQCAFWITALRCHLLVAAGTWHSFDQCWFGVPLWPGHPSSVPHTTVHLCIYWTCMYCSGSPPYAPGSSIRHSEMAARHLETQIKLIGNFPTIVIPLWGVVKQVKTPHKTLVETNITDLTLHIAFVLDRICWEASGLIYHTAILV